MGMLAERVTSRRALMINFAGQAAFSTAMIWAGAPAVMWTVVPILGFFNGAFGALFQLAAMDAFGSPPLRGYHGRYQLPVGGGVPDRALDGGRVL